MQKSIATREYRVFLRCLRAARKRAGVTQVAMAEKLGETQSWISKCERGERRLDIVETRAFCEAMGLTLASFAAEFEATLARRKR